MASCAAGTNSSTCRGAKRRGAQGSGCCSYERARTRPDSGRCALVAEFDILVHRHAGLATDAGGDDVDFLAGLEEGGGLFGDRRGRLYSGGGFFLGGFTRTGASGLTGHIFLAFFRGVNYP